MQSGGWGPPQGGPPGGFGPPQPGYGQQPQQPSYPQPTSGHAQPPAVGGYAQPGYPAFPQTQGFGPPAGGYGHPPAGQHPHAFGPQYGAPVAMPGAFGFTACPRCNSPHLSRPSFTWWGGLLGPKLLNHTVCGSCSFGFNSKTGKSNATAIGIYMGVAVGIAILFVILRIAAG